MDPGYPVAISSHVDQSHPLSLPLSNNLSRNIVCRAISDYNSTQSHKIQRVRLSDICLETAVSEWHWLLFTWDVQHFQFKSYIWYVHCLTFSFQFLWEVHCSTFSFHFLWEVQFSTFSFYFLLNSSWAAFHLVPVSFSPYFRAAANFYKSLHSYHFTNQPFSLSFLSTYHFTLSLSLESISLLLLMNASQSTVTQSKPTGRLQCLPRGIECIFVFQCKISVSFILSVEFSRLLKSEQCVPSHTGCLQRVDRKVNMRLKGGCGTRSPGYDHPLYFHPHHPSQTGSGRPSLRLFAKKPSQEVVNEEQHRWWQTHARQPQDYALNLRHTSERIHSTNLAILPQP